MAGMPRWTLRSIPAWAGETGVHLVSGDAAQVYPRVGGGNEVGVVHKPTAGGLSPRGRGKLRRWPMQRRILRSIPAWAGETKLVAGIPNLRRVYPRVGGGNASPRCCPTSNTGLSPRGRGKRGHRRGLGGGGRSIPAWAGETTQTNALTHLDEVYPRVGGGNNVLDEDGNTINGLSPRGRGKRPHHHGRHGRAGSIPAWAGETQL